MFEDRIDAGRRLALALEKFKDENVLVLAIPRGGVQVGCQIAEHLNAQLDIIISRKLPLSQNPEAGFGAIAEDGSIFIIPNMVRNIAKQTIDQIIYDQEAEIKRRIDVLRKGKPLPEIKDKTVILVDDGIAMGSTMRVSISLCRNMEAKKIIVAVPVTGLDTIADIIPLADQTIVLESPSFFYAVAQVYVNWYDVPDREVIETLQKWETQRTHSIHN